MGNSWRCKGAFSCQKNLSNFFGITILIRSIKYRLIITTHKCDWQLNHHIRQNNFFFVTGTDLLDPFEIQNTSCSRSARGHARDPSSARRVSTPLVAVCEDGCGVIAFGL